MHGVNWTGIAETLTGLATLIGSLGGFVGVCFTLYYQVKAKREQLEHKELLCNISQAVEANNEGNNSVPN